MRTCVDIIKYDIATRTPPSTTTTYRNVSVLTIDPAHAYAGSDYNPSTCPYFLISADELDIASPFTLSSVDAGVIGLALWGVFLVAWAFKSLAKLFFDSGVSNET